MIRIPNTYNNYSVAIDGGLAHFRMNRRPLYLFTEEECLRAREKRLAMEARIKEMTAIANRLRDQLNEAIDRNRRLVVENHTQLTILRNQNDLAQIHREDLAQLQARITELEDTLASWQILTHALREKTEGVLNK